MLRVLFPLLLIWPVNAGFPAQAQNLSVGDPAPKLEVKSFVKGDPVANLEVAVRIIRMNLDRFGGDWNKALAAYNAGAGAVTRHGGVPPYRETRNYLWKIYEYWCWLTGQQPVARPK